MCQGERSIALCQGEWLCMSRKRPGSQSSQSTGHATPPQGEEQHPQRSTTATNQPHPHQRREGGGMGEALPDCCRSFRALCMCKAYTTGLYVSTSRHTGYKHLLHCTSCALLGVGPTRHCVLCGCSYDGGERCVLFSSIHLTKDTNIRDREHVP